MAAGTSAAGGVTRWGLMDRQEQSRFERRFQEKWDASRWNTIYPEKTPKKPRCKRPKMVTAFCFKNNDPMPRYSRPRWWYRWRICLWTNLSRWKFDAKLQGGVAGLPRGIQHLLAGGLCGLNLQTNSFRWVEQVPFLMRAWWCPILLLKARQTAGLVGPSLHLLQKRVWSYSLDEHVSMSCSRLRFEIVDLRICKNKVLNAWMSKACRKDNIFTHTHVCIYCIYNVYIYIYIYIYICAYRYIYV